LCRFAALLRNKPVVAGLISAGWRSGQYKLKSKN